MNYDHISDFDYELPEQLIAQYPLSERSASRLMKINAKEKSLDHRQFPDLLELLRPNDLLVVNNTKVFPARLYGKKSTGGKIECLVERVLYKNRALVHLKASKSPKPGTIILFPSISATVIERQDDLFLLTFDCENLFDLLEKIGRIPLPSYIDRSDANEDRSRYQTVYARYRGAVAAPTAGLHFTEELIKKIKKKNITITEITLHVGAGTFQPLRVDDLNAHKMHHEYLEVSQETCDVVKQCQQKGGRVVAVGTTTLRALETAAQNGIVSPFQGDTDLFIRPGYSFRCVDVLLTNFHLPKSTLLMLVTAFGGYDLMMYAYQEAVKKEYRFYSYGDAMWIEGV